MIIAQSTAYTTGRHKYYPRALRGLGDATDDSGAQASALGARLAQDNANLQTIANAAASNAATQAAVGAQLQQAQAQITSLMSQFQALTGFWPTLGASIFFPYAISNLNQMASIVEQVQSLELQIQQMQAQVSAAAVSAESASNAQEDAASLADMSAAAAEQGDSASAAQYAALAAAAGSSATAGFQASTAASLTASGNTLAEIEAWLQNNWVTLAIVGAAIFVVPPLIKKL